MLPSNPTYPDLRGKVAVVAGGSRGIGLATARLLAANGVRVVVNGRGDGGVDAAVAALRAAEGDAIGVIGDCTQAVDLERIRQQTEQFMGPVDLLFAFVGASGRYPSTVEMSEADWRKVLDLNLTATFLTIRCFLPGMIERGRGTIVTMASASARALLGGSSAYATAKAGVIMLTRQVASEVAKYGIRVNCVSPSGTMSAERQVALDPAALERMKAMHPLGRVGLPEDTANAAVFLASNSASWITGVTLDVAGGRVMS